MRPTCGLEDITQALFDQILARKINSKVGFFGEESRSMFFVFVLESTNRAEEKVHQKLTSWTKSEIKA